jgi:hypothetical protein
MPPVDGDHDSVAVVSVTEVTFGAPGALSAEAVPLFGCRVTVVIEYGGSVWLPPSPVVVSMDDAPSRKTATSAGEPSVV